jgi:UTP:GlnB (protein PII) uridylyltransferase
MSNVDGSVGMTVEDPAELVRRFRGSMPASYRRAHGFAAIKEHAAIVNRRRGAVVHLEVWRVRRGPVIVIVADDRPGCFAMMSASIAVAGFDILLAETYRRAGTDVLPEAIGFFELRRPKSASEPITAEEIVPIAGSLEALLRGDTGADDLLHQNAPTLPPGPQASPDVAFADDDEASILLVEARDRPGLLATITSALMSASARIVDSEVITVGGRARDRFELTERDGSPLSQERRLAIASSVLDAVERAWD